MYRGGSAAPEREVIDVGAIIAIQAMAVGVELVHKDPEFAGLGIGLTTAAS